MTSPRVFFAAAALLFCQVAVADVGIGDSREMVIQQAGNPTSRAVRGDREILLYPHGGRVELIDGKVADVKGPLPTPLTEAPAATANAKPTSSAAESTVTGSGPTAAKPRVEAVPPAKGSPAASSPTDKLGREIEKMDTAWGQRPVIPTPAARSSTPKLLLSIVLHFAITLFALRIAFKIEEMDALWSGVFAIAGIDVALYAALELLGLVTNGLASMGAVESGIGALVMVYTIQKFCFTKKLQYAVVTAMSVKLIVRLCHMFVFVLLLNALFG